MASAGDSDPSRSLRERVCIVTGSTSGIGLATAVQLAAAGAKLVLHGRRDVATDAGCAEICELLQSCPDRVVYVRGDITDEASQTALVAAAMERFGRLDVLINNAGIVVSGSTLHTTQEDWDAVMRTNVTAAWRMSSLALPHMLSQRRGAIVNVASDWGIVAARDAVAYCVSKAALIQLTKCTALEVARDGVRVNAVCPGDTFVERWTRDGYFRGGAPVLDCAETHASSEIPMGRVADAAEIARVIAFLASDAASFMTGAALPVDGGNTAQ